MADKKKSQNSKSTSKEKTKNSHKKSNRSINNLKRPLTPYFLFCNKTRQEHQKKGEIKRLTAKELGNTILFGVIINSFKTYIIQKIENFDLSFFKWYSLAIY